MNKLVAPNDLAAPKVTTGALPASRKVFSTPDAAPDLRVPLREIVLSEAAGEPPLPVYDTSGPYTDASITIDVEKGLPRARVEWVSERGGVESYDGRPIKPVDNGNVSGKHLARGFPTEHKPLRGVGDKPITQYEWARARRDHQGNDLYRRARKSRPQDAAGSRGSRTRRRRELRRIDPGFRDARSSCARKSRAAAPSSRATSITPSSSR